MKNYFFRPIKTVAALSIRDSRFQIYLECGVVNVDRPVIGSQNTIESLKLLLAVPLCKVTLQ